MTLPRLTFLALAFFAPRTHAEITDLLPEGPRSAIKVSIHFSKLFLTVRSTRDLPDLYVTRERPDPRPGFLRFGRPAAQVADWVKARTGDRPSVKFGIWHEAERLGQTPRVIAHRIRRAEDGVQVFRVPELTQFLTLVERAEHEAGRLDIALVLQYKRPADWNASTKVVTLTRENFRRDTLVYESACASYF